MYVQKVMGEEDTPSPDRTMEPYLSCLNLFFSPERVEEFFFKRIGEQMFSISGGQIHFLGLQNKRGCF